MGCYVIDYKMWFDFKDVKMCLGVRGNVFFGIKKDGRKLEKITW